MPPGKPDSTLQELQQLKEQAKQTRQPFEAGWIQNVAMYQGNQLSFYRSGRFHKPQLAKHRVMFTDNRIIGIIRTEVARLTKERPVFVVTPRTGDEDDISAAKLGESVLDYVWNEHKLSGRLRSALLWARICSAGFWKVYWDSAKGDTVEVLTDGDGQPITGQDGGLLRTDDPKAQEIAQYMAEMSGGQYAPGTKKVAKGEICVEVRSPFEILPDPLAEEGGLEEAEWLIEESVRSPAYIKERYGEKIEPDADAVSGIAESRMPGGAATAGKQGSYKGVRVFELWHKPGSEHAKGRRVVFTEKQVLHEGDCPTKDLPYVMFGGIPVPGRFWPTSTTEQLRPPQVELNKTRSQIRENAARFGNLSLLKPRQSNVRYSGVPGEEVEYDITFGTEGVPQFLKPPEMPAYVQQELDRMEQTFNEISGQHDVSRGNVPVGVTAASAINLLQEADDSRMAIDVAQMEEAIGDAGSKVLDLVARYYTDERTIRLGGQDDMWEVFDFRGAMLKGNTHVEVQAGSGLPQSKAAKQAAMQELLNLALQYGLPLKPRDLRRFVRAYEVGGLELLFGTLSGDERQINRENRQMVQSAQPLPINSFDDDELHIEGHEEFQKGGTYARIVGQNPEVGAAFEQHVADHRKRYLDAQDAAAQAAGAAAGMPPDPSLTAPGDLPSTDNELPPAPPKQ